MRSGVVIALVVAGSLLAAACGSPVPASSIAPSGLPSAASPSSSLVAPSASPASASRPPGTLSASAVGSGLAVDPALLELLPPTLSGLDRQTDPDVDAQAFADPALRSIGTAGASALYADPSSGDFAYVTLIRLVGGRIANSAFRDYRDSFDAGACSQAGGVSGNAETTLGGRQTFIGSCGGGLLTYHALIPTAGVLLSISSGGDRHLGEQLASSVAG